MGVTQTVSMRRSTTWLGWWAILLAFWLLLTFTLAASELLVGATAAAIGATAAVLVWRQGLIGCRPRLEWVLRVHRMPKQLVGDTLIVFRALLAHMTRRREMRGAWRAIEIDPGGDDGRSAARRAMIIAAISFTPNVYVVGIDEDEGLMLVHQLEPSPKQSARRDITGWLTSRRRTVK